MKRLQFKCKLITDVIINQKAATEGYQNTLDFIPGGNFLGIVAGALYSSLSPDEAMLIFHSGKVRFGDAHPLCGGKRTLRVPASMYYPKLGKENDKYYIHHGISDFASLQTMQLKQCRDGFYAFSETEGWEMKVLKSFSIKSAYDRNERRSKDKQMYGYQSIDKGMQFVFEVEMDDDVEEPVIAKIKATLIGQNRRVGRSRTAQYGLVDITEEAYTETETRPNTGGMILIYADSRLVFLDETGQPTFQPTPKQLGIDSDTAMILWDKSQIRTFQYAPWNYKRQARDTDRCGIEKGSVFVVKSPVCPRQSQYIGVYKNEGFGKVIYNPDFLLSVEEGVARCMLKKYEAEDDKKDIEQPDNMENDPLYSYLLQEKSKKEIIQNVYEQVNEFVAEKGGLFTNKNKESFASQWGKIRSIAMRSRDEKRLWDEINKYITTGVAKEKWADKKNEKVQALETFMKKFDDSNAQLAFINLAAVMGKECSRINKEE